MRRVGGEGAQAFVAAGADVVLLWRKLRRISYRPRAYYALHQSLGLARALREVGRKFARGRQDEAVERDGFLEPRRELRMALTNGSPCSISTIPSTGLNIIAGLASMPAPLADA